MKYRSVSGLYDGEGSSNRFSGTEPSPRVYIFIFANNIFFAETNTTAFSTDTGYASHKKRDQQGTLGEYDAGHI
jgi:hypothetical protein